ncbi:MAG: TonB family protein [Kiritimatiellia bacterium]
MKQSSGHPELDRAAIGAVNKWKFRPAVRGGWRWNDIRLWAGRGGGRRGSRRCRRRRPGRR